MSVSTCHETRLALNKRRSILCDTLCPFHFSKLIAPSDCVLDLGCGQGDFINAVVAKRRIAVDVWPGFPAFLDQRVEAFVGSAPSVNSISIGDTSRFALRRMPRNALLTARRIDRVEALPRDRKDKISRITAWSENRRGVSSNRNRALPQVRANSAHVRQNHVRLVVA